MHEPDDVHPRPLEVHCSGRAVPAVLWIPKEVRSPLPLVLLGHGGGGHKQAPTVVAMAQGLAREHGVASLAIDGPVNGDRPANDDAARELRKADRNGYRRKYYAEKYDEMVQDWRAAIDSALALPELARKEVSGRAYHELFQRIGTRDKRLHANPGAHAAVPRSELEASRLFLARKLEAAEDVHA